MLSVMNRHPQAGKEGIYEIYDLIACIGYWRKDYQSVCMTVLTLPNVHINAIISSCLVNISWIS